MTLAWHVTSSVTLRSTKLGFTRQILQIYRTPFEFCKSDKKFLSSEGGGAKNCPPPALRQSCYRNTTVRRGLRDIAEKQVPAKLKQIVHVCTGIDLSGWLGGGEVQNIGSACLTWTIFYKYRRYRLKPGILWNVRAEPYKVCYLAKILRAQSIHVGETGQVLLFFLELALVGTLSTVCPPGDTFLVSSMWQQLQMMYLKVIPVIPQLCWH